MIWTLSHPMYLLLDHLCNKYFISNYYKSLSMIPRRGKDSYTYLSFLSVWWIGCPILLNILRITCSSQMKSSSVYTLKNLWLTVFMLSCFLQQIFTYLPEVRCEFKTYSFFYRVKFFHFPYLNKADESFMLCLTDRNKFLCS